MPPLPDHMRPLREADQTAAEALLRAAFPGPQEAALVRALRLSGAMELEMVLPDETGGLAGYLALSRMVAPVGWLALAPVAIAPGWQGKGLGRRLVSAVIRLTAIKGQTVVVLGPPAFYSRCGFSTPRAAALTSPYPIQNTLIARPGDDVPAETLRYRADFAGL